MAQTTEVANSDSEWEDPDFDAPMDVEALLAGIPESAMIKGLFVDGLRRVVASRVPYGHARFIEILPRDRYEFTRNYPRAEIMRVELEVARLLNPTVSDRQALRLAAHEVYSIFHGSFWGRLLLWPMRDDISAILRLGPRAFSSVVNFGNVTCENISARHLRYHYHRYYSWLDCGDLGMLEGLIQSHGGQPKLTLKRGESPFDCAIDIQW